MAKRVRTNSTVWCSFHTLDGANCMFTVYPQQTWVAEKYGEMVTLRNYKKGITIVIPMDDYKKNWVEKRENE